MRLQTNRGAECQDRIAQIAQFLLTGAKVILHRDAIGLARRRPAIDGQRRIQIVGRLQRVAPCQQIGNVGLRHRRDPPPACRRIHVAANQSELAGQMPR